MQKIFLFFLLIPLLFCSCDWLFPDVSIDNIYIGNLTNDTIEVHTYPSSHPCKSIMTSYPESILELSDTLLIIPPHKYMIYMRWEVYFHGDDDIPHIMLACLDNLNSSNVEIRNSTDTVTYIKEPYLGGYQQIGFFNPNSWQFLGHEEENVYNFAFYVTDSLFCRQ